MCNAHVTFLSTIHLKIIWDLAVLLNFIPTKKSRISSLKMKQNSTNQVMSDACWTLPSLHHSHNITLSIRPFHSSDMMITITSCKSFLICLKMWWDKRRHNNNTQQHSGKIWRKCPFEWGKRITSGKMSKVSFL